MNVEVQAVSSFRPGGGLERRDPMLATTSDEVFAIMAACDEVVASIEEALGRARSEAAMSGRFADIDWYRRAERALKATRRRRVAAQHRYGGLSRQGRQAVATALNGPRHQAFVDAAKTILPKEIYLSIWDRAHLISPEAFIAP